MVLAFNEWLDDFIGHHVLNEGLSAWFLSHSHCIEDLLVFRVHHRKAVLWLRDEAHLMRIVGVDARILIPFELSLGQLAARPAFLLRLR